MIKFTKMQGLGNDYVYIDCTKQDIDNPSKLAQQISDRHFGIGSDGLILICNSNIADFKMRMFNNDGSEAQMCGNGIRCVGKFVYDKGLTNKTTISIETLAGIKILKMKERDGKIELITVDMGEPILKPNLIPVISKEEIVQNLELEAAKRKFKFTCVSMGNPHAITLLNEDEDLEKFELEKYGSILEIDKAFPEKANVEFIKIQDKENILMRVWERGSGETLACGTGACATLTSCVLNKYTNREANVHLLGGTLHIKWDEKDNHIYMTGPAKIVFEGTIDEKGIQMGE